MNDLDTTIDKIHGQLDCQLAKWPADIIAENNRIDAEWETLTKEQDYQEAELQKLVGRLEELQKERERDDDAIENLSAALTSYLNKPISPPDSPFNPDETFIDLEGQIKDIIRQTIRPHIEDIRSELTEELLKHDADIYNTVWPKLTITDRVMRGISGISSAT
ncbi:hypothetical protein BT96DRAFT_997104 [Gymnopus androsaceus JB14]|uniref:Uncharacterized protein n=1 Tax=Gymnopus androsaceus JB14 TaxID=1447944 RepID=A0A6A4HCM4_9AGAR|nr:hypothetical protein BT96DRAFT_997104 [Gymnopus androsaceus JB14]